MEENDPLVTESATSLLDALCAVLKMSSIWCYLFLRLLLLTCEHLHVLTTEGQPGMCFQYVSGQLMKEHDN